MSLSLAEENHLKPLSVYTGPYGLVAPGTGVATVSDWETSDPPGRYEVCQVTVWRKTMHKTNLGHPLPSGEGELWVTAACMRDEIDNIHYMSCILT